MTRVRSSLTFSEKVKSIRTFLPFLLALQLAYRIGYAQRLLIPQQSWREAPPPHSIPLPLLPLPDSVPHYIMFKHGKDRTAKLFLHLHGSCGERASAAEAQISDYRAGTI